jgi:hypothetical protein
LQAAERHNFTVVEDDIFCDLRVKTTPHLATLDQVDRVIYAPVLGAPGGEISPGDSTTAEILQL